MAETSKPSITGTDGKFLKFPYPSELGRLNNYGYHKRLFLGKHFEAFKIKIDDPAYSKDYQKLRYITANFPGLISKVVADMLFIEPPKIQVADGDQSFMDALVSENKMRVQNYESALMNSYYGDALYKVRVGKKHPNNPDSTVIIEQVSPRIYFPSFDQSNVTGDPTKQELAWVMVIGTKYYLRKEIHSPGKIQNQLFELKGDPHLGFEIVDNSDLSLLGIPGLLPEQETGIDRSLLIHVPNWRPGEQWNGLSDYHDLDSLFYGINNRMTKVDNILDKHGDPILTVPPGVIGEDGKVKKKALGVIEIAEGESGKPEYVVWDAKLEAAENEIDKMIEITCMISETSPVVVGMDKEGAVESGRALKYKMLRTLAKTQRKQLYYREGMIEALYVAQLMAKEHNVKVDGIGFSGKPVKPEIIWSDGLPADMIEIVDTEVKRIDAGLQTKVDAVMKIDDLDQEAAEEKVKRIEEEGQIALESSMKTAAEFGKGVDGGKESPPVKKPNGFPAAN
jgi:hypothetical protein